MIEIAMSYSKKNKQHGEKVDIEESRYFIGQILWRSSAGQV
jgi:hypothetical protein